MRPATMPHDQAPAFISPCFMIRGTHDFGILPQFQNFRLAER
jgi:hypothetical protein